MRPLVLALAAFALVACSSVPPPPPNPEDAPEPPPDADPDVLLDSGASVCVAACARLRKLGCPEADPPSTPSQRSCVATCEHTRSARTTDLHPWCVARSKTVDLVRACGTVACVRSAR